MLLELGTRIRSCCSVSRNDKKRRGGGGGGGEIIVDVVSKVAHTDTREDGWKESKLLKKRMPRKRVYDFVSSLWMFRWLIQNFAYRHRRREKLSFLKRDS
jgi:hypothetical protein